MASITYQPPAPEGLKMDLSYLERIAKAAEKACAAVVDRPKDVYAREQLFDILAAVVGPAFAGDDPTRSAHLNDLLRQARVWADIVRHRIDGFRSAKGGDASAPSIQYPARDLVQILSELVGELARRPEA